MSKKALAQSYQLQAQLSRNSTPYQDPLARINWQSLDQDVFWLPEQAISLYGLNEYNMIPNAQRRALSQYELLNFIEASLWLESLFVERVTRGVRETRNPHSPQIYRIHKLREEVGHLLMFSELMHRCGLLLPNTRFYKWQFLKYLSRYAPFEGIVFWMTMLMGEEIPDRLNRFIRKNASGICPAIYDMVSTHIIEETRHITHAREILEQRFHQCNRIKILGLNVIAKRVFKNLVKVFYFPPARVYELAGLTPGKYWANLARKNPQREKFVNECVTTTLHVLKENNIQVDWR